MLSISTAASTRFVFSRFAFGDLSSSAASSSSVPSLVLVVDGPRRKKARRRVGSVSLSLAVAGKEIGPVVGFSRLRRGRYWNSCWWCCGFVRRSKGDWDKDGDFELETEILEFMRYSENPEMFPSKKQLIDAGRMDLALAIAEKGGWLAMGWDLDDGKEEKYEWNADIGDWDIIVDNKNGGNGAPRTADCEEESSLLDSDEVGTSGVSSFSPNSSSSASSSGRSLETANGDDSGIEGILSRLEKERNANFSLGLREKRNSARAHSNDGQDDWLARSRTFTNATVADPKRSSRPIKDNDDSVSNFDGLGNSTELDWRTWSMQRAASSNKHFEAGEISFEETRVARVIDGSKGDVFGRIGDSGEPFDGRKEINHDQIQNRIQNLELELSSVLSSLRSKADKIMAREGHGNSSEDLRNLSDAWEFQENEIMNTKDRLRSLRAKLAVLEGKMALSIINIQKIVDEKQKRIDDARKALRLLRTACIVWTNPASEVLLVGSYDGWATKRKMEKSKTGIFSVYLKLYPGKYEIKFIVDGEWKIDPLRPTVHDSGYENNLLMIT